MGESSERDLWVAHHKCGHAVIAMLKGIDVSDLNIDSSDDLVISIESDDESFLDASEFSDSRALVENHILISLAGYTATLKLQDRRLTSPTSHHYWDMLKGGCQHDLDQAKHLIALLSPTAREEDIYLQYYLYRARAIWDYLPTWITLSIVADKLIASRLISAGDAKFICESAYGIAVSFEDYRNFTGAHYSDIREHLIPFKQAVQDTPDKDALFLDIITAIERHYLLIINSKTGKVRKGLRPSDHVA